MKKLFILIFAFIFASCSANESLIDPINPDLKIITFDVVQKNLISKEDLPVNLQKLINQWFDNKVKINGFDGLMTFEITDYIEEISIIDEGKRVDTSLSFTLVLTKPTLSKTKYIEGTVTSFGTLSGEFSLNDFESVIQNTQSNLIERLSSDLKSKI
tara:strand:- start:2031 stop:2501 length:471 start_codon:yes stop_codon:yes gene_type:complete